MTTQAEIKKWAQPFIDQHTAMVQAKNFVLFRPIGHLMRSLAFWGGSDRHHLNPGWLLCPLCIPPGLANRFGNDIPVGYTNWPSFREKFIERTNTAIERYLIPHETLQDFYDLAWGELPFMHHFPGLPNQNAVLLAALGRFDEAETILGKSLRELELRAVGYLNDGNALLAKRPRSREGKFCVEEGTRQLALARELARLQVQLSFRDSAAVAALLRHWEHENVVEWGVEAYWQPTPFPFESA